MLKLHAELDVGVFDTNTVVSGLIFPSSIPAQALDKARAGLRLVASAARLVELINVFGRPKFDRYLPPHQRRSVLRSFESQLKVVSVVELRGLCRDPKDDKFLSLALAAGAKYIVTGDADLLVLDPFRGVRILTARDFLAV